jgi:hypothetical protein
MMVPHHESEASVKKVMVRSDGSKGRPFIRFRLINYLAFQSIFFAILFRPFGFIAPKLLNYLAFQPFDFELTQ